MLISPRLLRLARPARSALILAAILTLLSALAVIVQARLFSAVVARAFLGGEPLTQLAVPLRLLSIVILVRALLSLGIETASGTAAVQVKAGLRAALLAHIHRLGPAFTAGERTGEVVTAASSGVDALGPYFSQYLPQLASAAIVPTVILMAVFPYDPLSGLVLLFTAPLMPLFTWLIGRASETLTRRQYIALGRLSARFLDSLQGLETLKLLGRSRDQAESIARASQAYAGATLGVLRVTFLSALALELAATLSTAVVAVQVGLRLLYGRLEFEQALFILILAPEFYLPLRALGARFHAGMSGLAAAQRIFAVLDAPLQVTSSAVHPLPASLPVSIFPIRFERVSYTYPGADGDAERPAALEDITFTLESGQSLALVGATGSGKTTLALLLLRFIDPTAGLIVVNDVPLTSIPPEEWRRHLAWVPQSPHLFHGSLLENLRLARPGASPKEIETAVRLARLESVVASLPQGYDTPIGEGGARLSGGQAQRLALARAFLKGAPLLVLDEPTASLDPAEEALVQGAIMDLARSRAALIVAHRLSTVASADRILVIEGGRVVESGAHTELLALGGRYSALVAAARDAR